MVSEIYNFYLLYVGYVSFKNAHPLRLTLKSPPQVPKRLLHLDASCVLDNHVST